MVAVRLVGNAALLLSLMVLSACSSVSSPGSGQVMINPAPAAPPIQVAERYVLAPTFTALVVPAYTPGREFDLVNIAKSECSGKTFCSVAFWSDATLAPHKLKMSPVQATGRKAQFVFNSKTGLSRALWDCRTVTSIAGDCLAT